MTRDELLELNRERNLLVAKLVDGTLTEAEQILLTSLTVRFDRELNARLDALLARVPE